MSKWSNELKQRTLSGTFPSAVVKNEDHDYGIVMTTEPKVVINSIESGGVMPMPSAEVIATFDSVAQMVDAGWVLD